MGHVLNKAMLMLAEDERVVFVGQSVEYPGAAIHASLDGIPQNRRIEMPVVEDFQLGFCIGLSLTGKIPVCIYPRFDFLLLATNQLVNHLDRICEMSDFRPKVIVRTAVGKKTPLDAGPQHTTDYTQAFCSMLRNVRVRKVWDEESGIEAYRKALQEDCSTLVVET